MKRHIQLLSVCLAILVSALAAETIDPNMNWKIRQEATDHSQIMALVHQLTDLYGPRLTGSPNFKAACEWAIGQLEKWGLQNAHLEPWDFGHAGWVNDRHSVRVLLPYRDDLNAAVIAWTPSTRGTVRARLIQIDPPERPTQEQLAAYLTGIKKAVRGRIVLAGSPRQIAITFNAPSRRREEADLRALYDPNTIPAAPVPQFETPGNAPKIMNPLERDQRIDEFLLASGALVKIMDAARDHGQISALANRTYDCSKSVPGIVIRNEDYGRLARVLCDGLQVEMEVEITNTVYPDERVSHNAVAEIPGSDKKDQIVMMGSHIDSWHAATGATDNAAGVAVIMEASRILQKLGIRPRRTIRVAFWGGEEQGLLGSQAYVRDHFGNFESPKPEFSNLAAYFNIDYGTGRIRGASIFGPPESAAVLRRMLEPFADLGVVGAASLVDRSHGGTDSTSFNWAGLPGINVSQDPVEYMTDSRHTNLDTYERVLEDDLKKCAIVIAAAVYETAMREEMLPRFTRESMPPSR
jgi:carboxypeptidase Q